MFANLDLERGKGLSLILDKPHLRFKYRQVRLRKTVAMHNGLQVPVNTGCKTIQVSDLSDLAMTY